MFNQHFWLLDLLSKKNNQFFIATIPVLCMFFLINRNFKSNVLLSQKLNCHFLYFLLRIFKTAASAFAENYSVHLLINKNRMSFKLFKSVESYSRNRRRKFVCKCTYIRTTYTHIYTQSHKCIHFI